VDSDAEILGEVIFVRKELPDMYKLLCIGHELGHHVLHAKCIGYRITDKVLVKRTEREAETFASLILFPNLDAYESEQEFMKKSGLPPKTAKLRIQYFRRTGV
jgi:Zn-dependent peptidase ImmA (M78 family)